MRYLAILLTYLISIQPSIAQTDTWEGPATNNKSGLLQVSPDGRYLEYKNGVPFFYLADTAWELFHRLNDEEIEDYFENRRAKGFTVIQAVLLPELDGLNTPNRQGEVPLKDIENVIPNEAYFKWIDKVIRLAESKGLYMALLPTWGDKVDKQQGKGPQIFTPVYAQAYGTWLGKRYKNFKNIIWINGGDRWGGDSSYPIWDALGKGLKNADKNHLMTFYPLTGHSSSQWFNNATWLDFNMIHTGACNQDYEIYRNLLVKDYNRENVKPVLDGGSGYENQPICNAPDSMGWFNDKDIRKAMYWSLFSGACGYTYGCHDVWQMLSPGQIPVNGARGDWKTSLDLPGARQVIHARRLMERFGLANSIPANELIMTESGSPEEKIVALKNENQLMVYLPQGGHLKLTIPPFKASGTPRLEWMNPRNGSYIQIDIENVSKEITVNTPDQEDWILIVSAI